MECDGANADAAVMDIVARSADKSTTHLKAAVADALGCTRTAASKHFSRLVRAKLLVRVQYGDRLYVFHTKEDAIGDALQAISQ